MASVDIDLRLEAFKLMDIAGLILDTARELSALLRTAGIEGAVIGGVAVVLHRHIRTTVNVDLCIPNGEIGRFSEILAANDFRHDPEKREFVRDLVPVQIVTLDQIRSAPKRISEIEGVRTVSLADLIGMKLRSGTANLLRAQDLAGRDRPGQAPSIDGRVRWESRRGRTPRRFARSSGRSPANGTTRLNR